MATTVLGAFQEFAARLEPTAIQKQDASTKHLGVRDCLNGTMWIASAFLTGSHARSTLIRPPNDIDLFVVLDYAHHGNDYYVSLGGAQSVLERFHSRLKRCYPDTPIRKDHPSVRLTFATIGFDVIPAFNRAGGGFMIPSRTGLGWMSTDPTKHAATTSIMNLLTQGYFVPLVKMFKAWNVANGSYLTGFHLEMALETAWPRTLSFSPLATLPTSYATYSNAAAALLPALSSQLQGMTLDPAGLSGNVDNYLEVFARLLVRLRLDHDAKEAQIALRHEARGAHDLAITKWRTIFGDRFPAYG